MVCDVSLGTGREILCFLALPQASVQILPLSSASSTLGQNEFSFLLLSLYPLLAPLPTSLEFRSIAQKNREPWGPTLLLGNIIEDS